MRKYIIFGIIVLALLCAGCIGSSGKTGDNTFRQLYSMEADTLNYLTTTSVADFRIAANTEDSLVGYDQYGNIQPGLAESWESNEDMTEWTFHLRPGLKWVDKNGKEVAEVTAEDFVTAARYVNNAANKSASQYMYSTGSIVHNAQAYYDYTEYMLKSKNGTVTSADGKELKAVPAVKAEDIGVYAKDKLTLVYRLDRPCFYFPSITSFAAYLPVNKEYLDKWGSEFAKDEDHMLYCGAYYLSNYEAKKEQVLKKNPSYWDKEHVFIENVVSTFDSERDYHEAYMFLKGEVDYARITESIREEWLSDPEKRKHIHTQRPDYAYSYFYCFNFDPKFDAQYEPDNWSRAVANESFRKAVMTGMDRVKSMETKGDLKPSVYLQNTVTPKEFTSAGGKDFTDYDALKGYNGIDFYNAAEAVAYKEKAMKELAAEGVQFPVKVLMPYNPAVPLWKEESYEMEKQLENTLGKDFIDVIVEAGPETGFLKAVRRSGKFALLKCNWGADYVDPETWSQPFRKGGTYMFWDKSDNAGIQALFAEWDNLTKEAYKYYKKDDISKRYDLYAKAEALLISHAIVIPFSTFAQEKYVMSRVNEFEGGFAPCSLVAERYKYQHLQKNSMSQEEFDAAYSKWKKERDTSLAK